LMWQPTFKFLIGLLLYSIFKMSCHHSTCLLIGGTTLNCKLSIIDTLEKGILLKSCWKFEVPNNCNSARYRLDLIKCFDV